MRNQVFQFSKVLLLRIFKLTPVVVKISDAVITFDVVSFEVLLIWAVAGTSVEVVFIFYSTKSEVFSFKISLLTVVVVVICMLGVFDDVVITLFVDGT